MFNKLSPFRIAPGWALLIFLGRNATGKRCLRMIYKPMKRRSDGQETETLSRKNLTRLNVFFQRTFCLCKSRAFCLRGADGRLTYDPDGAVAPTFNFSLVLNRYHGSAIGAKDLICAFRKQIPFLRFCKLRHFPVFYHGDQIQQLLLALMNVI